MARKARNIPTKQAEADAGAGSTPRGAEVGYARQCDTKGHCPLLPRKLSMTAIVPPLGRVYLCKRKNNCDVLPINADSDYTLCTHLEDMRARTSPERTYFESVWRVFWSMAKICSSKLFGSSCMYMLQFANHDRLGVGRGSPV